LTIVLISFSYTALTVSAVYISLHCSSDLVFRIFIILCL